MKRKLICWIAVLFLGLAAGCAAAPQEQIPLALAREIPQTQGGTARTHSSEILATIWSSHTAGERFLVFGGDPENSVREGPGDLETADPAMLEDRFFLTPELSAQVVEGAAMEHLLNRQIFCSSVFRLSEGADAGSFAWKLCSNLESVCWQDNAPQRFLVAMPEEGFVLLAFGREKTLDTFLIRMSQAFPQGKSLYYQEIAQKRGR